MSPGRIVLVVLILLGVVWGAGHWLNEPDRQLMTAPPRRGAVAWPPPSDAFIGIPVYIDAAGLSRFASLQAPKRAGIPGQRIWQEPPKEIVNRITGQRQVVQGAAMYGNGEIVRSTPVSVRAQGRSLLAATTLDVQYRASMNRLRASSRASMDVSALVDYGIGSDWKPTVSVQPNVQWSSPPSSNFFGMANVSYGAQARAIVDARIRELERVLPERAASALPVEAMVRALWEAGALPTPLSASSPLRLSIRPRQAYFLAPKVQDDGLLLDIGIAGEAVLEDATAPIAAADPLPAPRTQPPEHRKFRFPVPVRLDYDALADQLLKVFSSSPVRIGNGGAMTVHEVKLYPTAPGLVLALRVEADLPGRWLWFAPRGWIYLNAMPRYDDGLRTLMLEDFSIDPVHGDAAVLSQALSGTGLDDLRTRASLPLSNSIGLAINGANQWLNYGVEGALIESLRVRHPALRAAVSRLDVQGDLKPVRGPVTLSAADDALWLFHPVSGEVTMAISLDPL